MRSNLLIITGSLVGSSGAILSYVMCRAMNRSFANVILGGLSASTDFKSQKTADMQDTANIIKVDGVVDLLQHAKSIIIVPGYGMAVARCQTDLAQCVTLLRNAGKKVRFCIHPVAGRLPGHMNVLLAEAKVPYDVRHTCHSTSTQRPAWYCAHLRLSSDAAVSHAGHTC